jgi:hypothetical protein
VALGLLRDVSTRYDFLMNIGLALRLSALGAWIGPVKRPPGHFCYFLAAPRDAKLDAIVPFCCGDAKSGGVPFGLDARTWRRAHTLARHPNRLRRGGRPPQTPWRGSRGGMVPATRGGRDGGAGGGGKGGEKCWREDAAVDGSTGRGGAAVGVPAATLLHSASAPSTGRARAAFSAGTSMGHVAEGDDCSGHGHGRPRAACSAALASMGSSTSASAFAPSTSPLPASRRPRACSCQIRHRALLPTAADLASAVGGSRGGIWAPTKGAEEMPPREEGARQGRWGLGKEREREWRERGKEIV